jgi:Fe-S-cluster containining protein
MTMNCEGCLARCKGECCQNVPLPKRLFTAERKCFRPIRKILDVGDQFGEPYIVPVTDDNRCPFLDPEFHCSIYDERPIVCQKFGDESCTFLTCSWQDKDGRMRSRQERRNLDRMAVKGQKKVIERLRAGKPLPSDIEVAKQARDALKGSI